MGIRLTILTSNDLPCEGSTIFSICSRSYYLFPHLLFELLLGDGYVTNRTERNTRDTAGIFELGFSGGALLCPLALVQNRIDGRVDVIPVQAHSQSNFRIYSRTICVFTEFLLSLFQIPFIIGAEVRSFRKSEFFDMQAGKKSFPLSPQYGLTRTI